MSVDIGQPGGIPNGATFITAASGNVAAAAATATLTSAVGRTAYILGAGLFPMGATAGLIVLATITGLISGTFTIPVAAPVGVLVGGTPVVASFGGGIPASATNTNIVVSMPSMGSGNTNAAVVAWGFLL